MLARPPEGVREFQRRASGLHPSRSVEHTASANGWFNGFAASIIKVKDFTETNTTL